MSNGWGTILGDFRNGFGEWEEEYGSWWERDMGFDGILWDLRFNFLR